MHFSAPALALCAILARVSYSQAQAEKCEHVYGGDGFGWVRVRHVPAGGNWHPAYDNLAGTAEYGTEGVDDQPWSIKFSSKFPETEGCSFDLFLFASGDCTKWLVATPDAVNGENYSNAYRTIIASSESASSYSARWYNRGSSEDPWVSTIDHGPAVSQNKIVYGEASNGYHVHNLNNGGADVYVRSGCHTTETEPPTDVPTKTPTDQPTKSPTDMPTHAPTPAIRSWALEFKSLSSNFTRDVDDELTLMYNIGKGREFDVKYLTNCQDDVAEAINVTFTASNSTNSVDASLDELELALDIKKDSIYGSNIWDADAKTLELCVRVELLSGETVMKKLERNIKVELDFESNFQTVADAKFDEISLLSNETEAAVEKYVEACTCDSGSSFTCNTNSLGLNDFINVCVWSAATEMEINYLDSLKMDQGDKTLDIVSNKDLVDSSISSKSKVPGKNGVHVASVIPNRFFSYDGPSTAEVSGVIYLKLKGSSRRLAVEVADAGSTTSSATRARALQSDQESAFSMEVQLEKNELDAPVDTDSNGAAIYAVMTRLIGVATAVGAFMMW